jgi:hypothetical protein
MTSAERGRLLTAVAGAAWVIVVMLAHRLLLRVQHRAATLGEPGRRLSLL